ncbi:hypothetical protein BHM03_00041811 [Ensete ventricosum]|nr:hypothetical protein BHM03_00041811 [Ensete ventricosum]
MCSPYRRLTPYGISSNAFVAEMSMASNVSAEEAGVPRSVPVAVAHELLKAGDRYLVVRLVTVQLIRRCNDSVWLW